MQPGDAGWLGSGVDEVVSLRCAGSESRVGVTTTEEVGAMADDDVWSKIHAERAAFADLVASFTPEQLDAASRCADWRVRDVIGHMLSTAHTSPASFFSGFVASGFKFNAFNQKGVERYHDGTATELADQMRATTTMTNHPPGPTTAMLGEMIVHGDDVRQPLGVQHSYLADHVIAAADFYKTSNLLLGSKKRIAGLTMRATDMDWSTGSGPEVVGPGAALVSAMTGRKEALGELEGDGVEQFASRF
jgi:uncharacterized protein (TIGR03083 family)